MTPDLYNKIRLAMLLKIHELDDAGAQISVGPIITDIKAKELTNAELRTFRTSDAYTVWFDLFRAGVISLGNDHAGLQLTEAHLTPLGKRARVQLSRDPYNPASYLWEADPKIAHNEVVTDYVYEAVGVFNSGHIKAAAILLGVATEALQVELRDVVAEQIRAAGREPPKDMMNDRSIKAMSEGLEGELKRQKASMGQHLADRFESIWRYVAPVRLLRNAVGHAVKLDQVSAEAVHGNFIFFHDIAQLMLELKAWARTAYGVPNDPPRDP